MRVHYEMCVSIEYSKEAIKNSYNHRFEKKRFGTTIIDNKESTTQNSRTSSNPTLPPPAP